MSAENPQNANALDDLLGPPPADPAAFAPTKILETIVMRFLARVIHADGQIDPKELSMLVEVAIKLGLGGDEARRILDDELTRKSNCAVLAAQIPDEARRREVYAMGCLVGAADGSVGDVERAVLAEFAQGAQLPDQDAREILDAVIEAALSAKKPA